MVGSKREWQRIGLVFLILMGLVIPVKAQEGSLEEQAKKADVTIQNLKELRSVAVTAAAVDREGNIWFGTRNGVHVYPNQPGSWLQYTEKDGLPDNYITSIAVGADNVVWVGTEYGLAKFDGSSWIAYTTENTNGGLADNDITAVAIDGKNNVWCGTENAGVSMHDVGGKWHNLTTKDGLINNTVWSIALDDKNNIWFGTRKGVSKYDGKEWINYTLEGDELADNMVFSIGAKDSYLWFGTGRGVSAFDTIIERWTRFDRLLGTTVISVAATDQNVWFGTSGDGVYSYELKGNNWTKFTEKDGLADNIVTSIVVGPNNKLWLGTYGSGISLLEMK